MISIITAVFQSPLNLLSLLETCLISDARNIMRNSSLCMIAQASASLAQSNTHAQYAETQEWRNKDCAVVTMALVSDFSHPESIILLNGILTDSVHGKSLLVDRFRSICYLHYPFTTSSPSRLVVILLSLHRSQSFPSLRWIARCFSFRLVLRHANAFLCPSLRR